MEKCLAPGLAAKEGLTYGQNGRILWVRFDNAMKIAIPSRTTAASLPYSLLATSYCLIPAWSTDGETDKRIAAVQAAMRRELWAGGSRE